MELILANRTTLGSHIPLLQGDLYNTIKSGIDSGMYSIQIFLGGNMSLKRKQMTDEDLKLCQINIKLHKLNVFTHLPYCINCCGVKKLGKLCSEMDYKNVDTINYELEIMDKICCNRSGCVLHIGSWNDKKIGIREVITTLNKVKYPKNSYLCLEYMVKKGSVLGTSFHELKTILDGIHNKNVKICLDTAHIHGNGDYDLGDMNGIDKMFDDFISIFGDINKLGLIHLNDSQVNLGDLQDKHDYVGFGKIWGNNHFVLKYFLDKINLLQIPTVLETTPENYPFIQSI